MFMSKLAKKTKRRKIIISMALVLAVLTGCASKASKNSVERQDANMTSSSNGRSSVSYFTGSGGKGMKLGILVLESKGLNANQAYLPAMVQGCLVSNVSKYSAITVLDRVSLDKVIAETLNETYEDNFDIVRIGHVAQVEYMLTGSIMRTSSGYALQLNVTKTTPDAPTVASYSGTCTAAQFDDFSAIHRASKELLTQMGVQLTNAAAAELDKPSSTQTISAQTNLAQGIVAQQKGTVVEAMAYYYNAVSFDPKLSEASGRLSALSTNISSGNIGENIRNDIQQRNEWIKILNEAEDFFSKHLPFELVYSNSLSQGKIDYTKGNVELKSSVTLRPSESIKVFDNILEGLEATGRRKDWGFGLWPVITDELIKTLWNYSDSRPHSSKKIFRWVHHGGYQYWASEAIVVNIVLINENGNQISKAEAGLRSKILFTESRKKADEKQVEYGYNHNYIYQDRAGNHYLYDMTKLKVSEDEREIRFIVNANDITDNLTIKIVSVNGIDVAKNPDYIRITVK
jgi:TolB-like protein